MESIIDSNRQVLAVVGPHNIINLQLANRLRKQRPDLADIYEQVLITDLADQRGLQEIFIMCGITKLVIYASATGFPLIDLVTLAFQLEIAPQNILCLLIDGDSIVESLLDEFKVEHYVVAEWEIALASWQAQK